jgi:Ni2+-binding GTPase involved in maturation of urease and hydrogenase
MLAIAKPIAFALFVWWFSTGMIIWLDGLPRKTFKWSMLGATVVLGISLYGLWASASMTSPAAAYCAFSCGLLAWGWQEISFYMGYVTGNRKEPCPEGCGGFKHFIHAVQTSLWHELSIIAFSLIVIGLTWGQPNQVGMWTFMVLWWMHQSAKLNVFFGVRNLNEEFLPEHLEFLKSFLTKKPMNLLFPVSITVSTLILGDMATRTMHAVPGSFEATAWLFIATLMFLAILEHWFLVLPIPAAALWEWGLHKKKAAAPFTVDVVAGFLGAGKTTEMRRLLAEAKPEERTLVLANDFSNMGIDASLLAGRGADVVELANGCICCSLQKDLAKQLVEIANQYQPSRVLIEPSGVADVASLIAALRKPTIAPLVKNLRVLTLVDAAAFLSDFARMPQYFEAQARVSPVVMINKTDLVFEGSLTMIRHTLNELHPGATVVFAHFGMPQDGRTLTSLLADLPVLGETKEKQTKDQAAWKPASQQSHSASVGMTTHQSGKRSDQEIALGFESWSASLQGICDPERLRELLDSLVAGRYGQLERVKGIVRAGEGWVRFDLAGGRPSIAAHAAEANESPRVMAIGKNVDEQGLLSAFMNCALPGAYQHG